MTTFLFPLLVKLGVPEKLRAPLQWALVAAAGVLAFLAARALYDASVVEEYEEKRAIRSIEARDQAAEERAQDTVRTTLAEKEMHDVIDSAPKGGALSPAARALACERLRRRGGDLPAACGPAGGG